MEENVALDSTKKKKFLKSIKGIKKLIKKNDEKEVSGKPVNDEPKEKKKRKKFIKQERGLVYLSHIPHGFYEHQMTEYFKQFGAVTNARVIRSERTGRSKGFAFVEFREPAVGQIVAETMNNYLMGKRLLKAAYIPPEKQKRFAKRKNWNEEHNPGAVDRIKHKKAFNAVKDDNEELKKAKKILSNLQKTKTKLSELGINYDFFMPVDVPLALIKVKEEKDDENVSEKQQINKENKPTKKEIKAEKQSSNDKQMIKDKKNKNKTVLVKPNKELKSKKEIVTKDKIQKVDKKEQEQKQNKLDNAGVKNVENFIKVQESDNDSDSSVEFDSDEYEKMLSDESELGSDESDESGDESENDDGSDGDGDDDEIDESEGEEESVVDYPPVKPKGKTPQVLAPKKKDKQVKQQEQVNKNAQVKRKAPQKAPVSTKKPKFEKQNKPIPVKKQFKKKK